MPLIQCSFLPLLFTAPSLNSARHQPLVANALVIKLNDHTVDSARAVLGSWVDADRASDIGDPSALVDVPMEGECWLDLFDHLAHCRTPNRNFVWLAAYQDRPQTPIKFGGRVQAAVERRHVEVENRALSALDLADQRTDSLIEVILIELSRRVPRSP